MSLSELVQRVDDVHRTTQKNVQKIHDRVSSRNDKINRTHKFELGGLVWLHRVFPGTKSPAANGRTRAWFWPCRPDLYVIDKKSSPQHVRIRLHQPHNGNDKAQTVHVHRLKPFHPSQDAFTFGDLNLLDATRHAEQCSSDYWHTPPQPQHLRHQHSLVQKQKSASFAKYLCFIVLIDAPYLSPTFHRLSVYRLFHRLSVHRPTCLAVRAFYVPT